MDKKYIFRELMFLCIRISPTRKKVTDKFTKLYDNFPNPAVLEATLHSFYKSWLKYTLT